MRLSVSVKYCRKSYEALGDTSREDIIADDMIIASTDEVEHDSTLRTVMLKARDENIKYHKDTVERNRDKIHAGPCMTSEWLKKQKLLRYADESQ